MKIKSLSSKLFLIFLAAVLVTGIISAGCFRSAATATSDEAEAPREMPAMEEVPAQGEMTAAEGSATLEEKAADTDNTTQYGETVIAGDRKVIKTAYIELEIEKGKFDETLFALTSLADQSGGFVSNSQSYSDSEGNLTSGYVTIRVPSNNYNSALDRIKQMGTIKSISSSGQDITQEYTDLESRLRNYQAQEDVLLELMKKSTKVSDSIEVQRELSNVQEQIEIIKGRMNYLDDMVSYSTIDVAFHEPEPITTGDGWGFVEALKRGLRGLVTVFNALVVALIATAPVWILIGIILIIVWQAIRARKRRRARREQK